MNKNFWNKVNKNGPIPVHAPQLGQCWAWTGMLRNGYGLFRVGNKIRSAHIISYEQHTGSTDGLKVCHKCDNRMCIRPTHLFLGTTKKNHDDMKDKGRAPTSLTKEEILQVHRAPLTNTMINDLSIKYKVSEYTIRSILTGRTCEYYTGGENRNIPRQKSRSQLTDQDIQNIQQVPKYHGVGIFLSDQYGVTPACISLIRSGKYHRLIQNKN